MQGIQFSSNYGGAKCSVPVAPVVGNNTATIAVGAGATASPLYTDVAAGSDAYFGGQVWISDSCYGVQLDITYIQDGDCSTCPTSSTSTTVVKTVKFPCGTQSVPVPEGYHQAIDITLLDCAGVAIANTVEVKAGFYSAYTPSCVSCAVKAV